MSDRGNSPGLKSGLTELGVPSSPAIVEQLQRFLKELSRWNRTYNLTRIPENEWIPQIIFQSAALHAIATRYPAEGEWMDMGTGPGIPGLILAILNPVRKIRLVDSRSKKTDFIAQICRLMNLGNVEIHTSRLEQLPSKAPETKEICSAVFARALGSIPDLIRWGSPFLKPSGRFFLPRGGTTEEEWVSFLKGNGDIWDGEIVRIVVPGMGSALKCLMVFQREVC